MIVKTGRFGQLNVGDDETIKIPQGILGFPELTPRTIRHSAVLQWHRDGLVISEIQQRLGLKTSYAFRAYGPLFKSDSEVKSTQ